MWERVKVECEVKVEVEIEIAVDEEGRKLLRVSCRYTRHHVQLMQVCYWRVRGDRRERSSHCRYSKIYNKSHIKSHNKSHSRTHSRTHNKSHIESYSGI